MPERGALHDRQQLRAQYATPTNLGKRASLYAFQQPQYDLPAIALDLLGHDVLAGPIVDVGCGPGTYLARFAAAGGQRLVGIDQSPGMAAAAATAEPSVATMVGDAGRLPFPDSIAAGTTALHMLYHVAEPRVALAELRRVTRPGGPVVILTNGPDHLRVLRDLRDEAIGSEVPLVVPSDRFGLEHAGLVEEVFGSVELHELRGEITITEPAPLVDYLASSRQFFEAASILPWDALVDRFADVVAGHLADGPVVLHSHSGFFRARA